MEKVIIDKICDIIKNSSLSVEIIYGTIKDLSFKAGVDTNETLAILNNNYNEWEK